MGRCQNCACVKRRQRCQSCLPQRLGNCANTVQTQPSHLRPQPWSHNPLHLHKTAGQRPLYLTVCKRLITHRYRPYYHQVLQPSLRLLHAQAPQRMNQRFLNLPPWQTLCLPGVNLTQHSLLTTSTLPLLRLCTGR